MPLEPGLRLGGYEIAARIGAGGMGEVWRARDTRLARDVAIKVLPEEFFESEERRQRFEREAMLLASLNHPVIATLYSFEEFPGSSFSPQSGRSRRILVMELLEGESFRSLLTRGPLSPRRATDLAIQVAEGLAAAHAKGVIHRDLKPENLFLTPDGHAKILDFGLARRVEPAKPGEETSAPTATKATDAGTIVGTLGYMSPEQLKGQPVDHRTDIFSFGAVLYEMLTGRAPFVRGSSAETISAILNDDVEAPAESARPIPLALLRIVEHCLEKSPQNRFRDAQDLAFALENAGSGSMASPIPSLPTARWRANVFALGSAAAVVAASLGFFAGRVRAPKPAEPPRFTQLTFSEKPVLRARFTRDGRSVVYGLAGSTTLGRLRIGASVHELSLGNPIPRTVFANEALLLAVSSTDQLAVVTDIKGPATDPDLAGGTLGIAPLGGALPRAVSNGVLDAAWHPDGRALALIRVDASGSQVEFPEGKILHRMEGGGLSGLRFSPDGRFLAMFRRPVLRGDDMGSVALLEVASGKLQTLGSTWDSTFGGLAFKPDGLEIWFGAARAGSAGAGTQWEIRGVDLEGKERRILGAPSGLRLMDVAPDGRALVEEAEWRTDALSYEAGTAETRRLTIRKSSLVQEVSRDARMILVNDLDSGPAPNYDLYIRPADGSLPTPVGRGFHAWISEDSRTVLVWRKEGDKDVFVLVPVVGGAERALQTGGLHAACFSWSRTGELYALAWREKEPPRLWRVSPDEAPRAVSGFLPEDANFWFWLPEPDGRRALVFRSEKAAIWAQVSDPARPIEDSSWIARGEWPLGFSEDGAWVYFRKQAPGPTIEIERLSLADGKREPFRKVTLPGIAGDVGRVCVSPDATRLVVGRGWFTSQLFLVEGMR